MKKSLGVEQIYDKRVGISERVMMRYSHPVPHGLSIREKMEAALSEACQRYVEMEGEGWGKGDKERATQRGIVRGMATQLVILTGPFERSPYDMIVMLERRYVREARNA